MTNMEKDDIILQAALEYGPDYEYDIRQGSLGMTLYVHIEDKSEASVVRLRLPGEYEGLRTIVTYNYDNIEKAK